MAKSKLEDRFELLRDKENIEKEEESAQAVQQTIGQIVGNPFENAPSTVGDHQTGVRETKKKNAPSSTKRKMEPAVDTSGVDDLFSDLQVSEGGVAGSYYLDREVVAAIENIAVKYKISKSKALNRILRNALNL